MISFKRLILTALIFATIASAPVWAMATPTTNTAATKTTDCQAGNKPAAHPIEIEVIEIEEDQPDQAANQNQNVEDDQDQAVEDDEADNSFFGKPDSAKRWCWYIGGGIVVVASAAALFYYYYYIKKHHTIDIRWRDNGLLTENEKRELGHEMTALIKNQQDPYNYDNYAMEALVHNFLNQHHKELPPRPFCIVAIDELQRDFLGLPGHYWYKSNSHGWRNL